MSRADWYAHHRRLASLVEWFELTMRSVYHATDRRLAEEGIGLRCYCADGRRTMLEQREAIDQGRSWTTEERALHPQGLAADTTFVRLSDQEVLWEYDQHQGMRRAFEIFHEECLKAGLRVLEDDRDPYHAEARRGTPLPGTAGIGYAEDDGEDGTTVAKYTEEQLIEMGASTFEKKVRCYLVEENGRLDVIYVCDDGTTVSKFAQLQDRGGVVYLLPRESPFDSWWRKVTGVAKGLVGILNSPLAAFIGGFTGWPVAKLQAKLRLVGAAKPKDVEAAVRDEIGSHKGGRLLLAVEEIVKHGLTDDDRARELGKLLGGNE